MMKFTTTLQHLPQESVVYILRYLPITEAVHLEAECSLLNASVLWLLKSEVKTLPRRLMREIKVAEKNVTNVPVSDEGLRIDYCNALTFLRYMLMETLLLRATVWRYIENDKALSLLIHPLSLVLKEFSDTIVIAKDPSINKMVRREFTKPALIEWEMFLNKFYSNIEESLNELLCWKIPFGVKVIDLLHCSFSANIQSNLVIPYNEDVYSVNVFFETRDSNHSPPDVNNADLTDGDKLKMIMKHLREVIRSDNRAFINRKTDAISSLEQRLSNARDNIFEELIEELRESYTDIVSSPFPETLHNQGLTYPQNQEVYSEIFFRGNNYNASKTGTVCSLKMVCDKRFLPLDYQSGDGYKQLTGGKPSVSSMHQQNGNFWHREYLVDAHLTADFPSVDVSRNYDMCAYNEFCTISLVVFHDLYYVPLIKQGEVTISITKDETIILSFEETVLDNTNQDIRP